MVGDFANAVISFVLISAAVYYLVVLPIGALMAKMEGPPAAVTTKNCPQCLSTIPLAAKRCAFCTAAL